MLSSGALVCFALKVRHGWHLSICSLACTAMWCQKKQSCIRSSICSRPKWPTSSWHPFREVSLCTAGKSSWNRAPSDSLGRVFLYRMPCLSLRWLCSHRYCHSLGGSVCLSWHWLRVPSCSLTMTRLKTMICSLNLMPVIYGQASDLQTVLYWFQDMQITAMGFDWACRAFKSSLLHSSYCCCSDLDVGVKYPTCTPARTLSTEHPHQYWSSMPYNTTENVVGQAGHPLVTCSIHLGHG